MKQIENRLYPEKGMYLKNIHTVEIYPDYIIPAKSLTRDDFVEVTEEEYQMYLEELRKKEETPALTIEERFTNLENEVTELSATLVNQI